MTSRRSTSLSAIRQPRRRQMPDDPPRHHCPDCDRNRLIAEGERNDRMLAEKEVTRLRRVEQGLRAQLTQRHKDDPGAKTVREILDYWQPLMPRAKTPLDGVRADAVRKALAAHTPAELKEAIEGAYRRPYVWKDGQRMRFGTSKQRFIDITLLFRDERTIERF